MKPREWWLRLNKTGTAVIHSFNSEHLWCVHVREVLSNDPRDEENKRLKDVLEAVRSQMCWELDRDQLTMGMKDLYSSVTQALALKID